MKNRLRSQTEGANGDARKALTIESVVFASDQEDDT